ncbi:MAG: guanylate kinase [Acidimicrobiia bacterium]|nr:guanylate kinase [Acidimicrobiia bacterium]
MLAREPRIWFSVSATDRARRAGEVDGRDYLFISPEEFRDIRDAGGFLECFDVYGDLKGTPRAPVEEHLRLGDDVLLEVDVQGAMAVRQAFPDALLIFVRPPSREVQRRRLLDRDPDIDPTDLGRRLAEADAEEALAAEFDASVVNDDLDDAVGEIQGLMARRRLGGT